ncbi:hypothetical protein TVAG_011010 [Trichomonas vaginalis G3]|uniref:Uncharacterized protein n=1 Tax=Trichomonas vaginalis (strain ATCC PRA-98 / G3) TaxID=412133 RepID=A2DP27_TRIV3|nr:general transcription factor IIH subunit 1 family [Trichomonas vaginalis G3]EAY17876.1 hypothetical protein TVAG_011010 [Trichomonas vaginalis G3]KAI5489906.1 general transcription factor IIH subunit 1 family [Trichomonas vaginalis G3]|eukprot:XP_001330011.1 hypothetical protein [Trichomonas vaginalis G3]
MEKLLASNEFQIKTFDNIVAKLNGQEYPGILVFTNGHFLHYVENTDSLTFRFGPDDLENEALSKKSSKDVPLTEKSQSMLRIFNNQTKRNIILSFIGTTCNSDVDQVIEQYKVLKSSPPLPVDNVVDKLKEVIPEELLLNENNELDPKYAKDLLKNNPVLDNLMRTYPELLEDDYLVNFQNQIIAGMSTGRLLPQNIAENTKKEFAKEKKLKFKTGDLNLDNHLVSQIFRKHPEIYTAYQNLVPSKKSEEEFFRKDFIQLLKDAKAKPTPPKPAALESDLTHGQGFIEKVEIEGEELKSLQAYADAISVGNKYDSVQNTMEVLTKTENEIQQTENQPEEVIQIPPHVRYQPSEEELQQFNDAILEMNQLLAASLNKQVEIDQNTWYKALEDMTPDDGLQHVFVESEEDEILQVAIRKAELQIFAHAFWQAVNTHNEEKYKKLGAAIEKIQSVVNQEANNSKLKFLFKDLEFMFRPILEFMHR